MVFSPFVKQSVVMVVGPDMTGKSQIAKELARITLTPYYKASSEHDAFLSSRLSKNELFLNQLRYADPRVFDLFKQCSFNAIFDRAYPCERVYSEVFYRVTDDAMLEHLDQQWASIGTKVILCQRSSYEGITDDLDPTVGQETLQKLHVAYDAFASWTKCSVLKLNVDDENLEREVNECMKFMGYDDNGVIFMRVQAERLAQQKPQIACANTSVLWHDPHARTI